MMKLTMFVVGVGTVIVAGFAIDAQSRPAATAPQQQVEGCRIFAPGRVEAASPEVELRLRLAGRIQQLAVEEGQFVEEGELLVQLDDEQFQHNVSLAAAELELAEAQLERLVNGARSQQRHETQALYRAKQVEVENAKRSWERIRALREARAISRQEADDQEAMTAALTEELEAAKARVELLEAPARTDDVRIAQARIQAAKASLQLAKTQLDRTSLQAPSRGQILEVTVETGELTGPDSPKPVIVMADTTGFRVRAFVEEMDAPRVQVDMRAQVVTDGLPDQQFEGRVTRLSPRMNHKQFHGDQPAERYDTKTREIWIDLEDADDLVMGLRVDVMLDPATGPGPSESLPSEEIESNDQAPADPVTLEQS